MSQQEHHDSTEDRAGLRATAIDIVRRLSEAGFEAYFAGGCVRDRLMGHEPKDYDVATSARPDDIKDIFKRAHSVGESFGVMLVRIKGHVIEVATFRTDGVYSDARRPDSVTFSDAKHDAQRRDFTINGLFENPLTEEIIDYVEGRADLEHRVIRAIGDPQRRIDEDRLRMLRAIRFAARFGFQLDEATAQAICQRASDLGGVSRERIGHEVRAMLKDQNRAVAAWELQYLGLDEVVLNESPSKVAPTRLGRLPDLIEFPTALAAWMLDRHAKDTLNPADVTSRWGQALMLSNEERREAYECLRTFLEMESKWPELGIARQKRIAASSTFVPALAIMQATDRQSFIDIQRRVAELKETGLSPQPLIDGNDLIRLGLPPGESFGPILDAVYDAQLEGSADTREQAESLALTLARSLQEGRGGSKMGGTHN